MFVNAVCVIEPGWQGALSVINSLKMLDEGTLEKGSLLCIVINFYHQLRVKPKQTKK